MTQGSKHMPSLEKVHGTRLELVQVSPVEPKATRPDRRTATLRDLPVIPWGECRAFPVPPICPPPERTVRAITVLGLVRRSTLVTRWLDTIAPRVTGVPPEPRESDDDVMAELRRWGCP